MQQNDHADMHVSLQDHKEGQHSQKGVERDSPQMWELRRGGKSIVSVDKLHLYRYTQRHKAANKLHANLSIQLFKVKGDK